MNGWDEKLCVQDLEVVTGAGMLLLQREIPDRVNLQVAQVVALCQAPFLLDDPNVGLLFPADARTLSCTYFRWLRAAQLRVCADGGANRVYDNIPPLFQSRTRQKFDSDNTPDVISGDLDSIRDDVKAFYLNFVCFNSTEHNHIQYNGVKVVDESHDQDTTDLHKCVAYVNNSTPVEDKSKVCIITWI
ncbi:thiamine pyrophosphokinase 3-like isoform X2 [Carex rostrata]